MPIRYTCDALRDLVPFVQFKKREKDWRSKSLYSVRIRENTDQKKLRIRTLFTQWFLYPLKSSENLWWAIKMEHSAKMCECWGNRSFTGEWSFFWVTVGKWRYTQISDIACLKVLERSWRIFTCFVRNLVRQLEIGFKKQIGHKVILGNIWLAGSWRKNDIQKFQILCV